MLVIVNKKKFARFVAVILLIVALLSVNSVLRLIYPLEYENEIVKYSTEFGLDKHLIMGIISAESGFDSDAQSHKDAHGLMQLKDAFEYYYQEEGETDWTLLETTTFNYKATNAENSEGTALKKE